jgi:hypothetical protein
MGRTIPAPLMGNGHWRRAHSAEQEMTDITYRRRFSMGRLAIAPLR